MVTSSGEFQSWLCTKCPSVSAIQGFLWQKARSSRFASPLAACFMLASRVEGEPLYSRLYEFLHDPLHVSFLESSYARFIPHNPFRVFLRSFGVEN
jgi:hypothetical protein